MAFDRYRLLLERAGMLPAATAGSASGQQQPHVVDILLSERSGSIQRHALWPLMRPLLYRALHYREAMAMADRLAPLGGLEALDFLCEVLALRLEIRGKDRIPEAGGFVLVANHPTGIADGIAVHDALRGVRRDLAILANRDAVRVNRRFADILVPVEWRKEHRSAARTRETLGVLNRAIGEGRAIVIFPSGRIAFMDGGVLTERPWQPSAVSLARRTGFPVLPVHIVARNSALFYLMSRISTDLRDITVFHELLNKKGASFAVTFGEPIEAVALAGEASQVTARLQHHCTYALAADADARFGG
jgi:putative hemolysin